MCVCACVANHHLNFNEKKMEVINFIKKGKWEQLRNLLRVAGSTHCITPSFGLITHFSCPYMITFMEPWIKLVTPHMKCH